MSRERNEEKKGLSPTQRKACVVLALCALAVVMSILATLRPVFLRVTSTP